LPLPPRRNQRRVLPCPGSDMTDPKTKPSAPACAPAPEGEPLGPITVEVTRGDLVESRHRAAFAVVDPAGRVVLSGGDIARPVYARSSAKPLQALPLVESGAAAAFDVSEAELALACASHTGEPRHVATVRAWLMRLGLGEGDLECGPQLPVHHATLLDFLQGGGTADAVHNNCSGKHSGFLTLARHLGAPTRGYIRYDHPVQQRILGVLEAMTGLDLGAAPRGIDGCGIPVIGIPLGNWALAFARLADPHDQPETRRAACARIRAAMTAEPFMVAGTGRFCTRLMQATGGRVVAKGGAEGFYCAALPDLGLGVAIKAEDGADRAAEITLGQILRRLDVLGDGDTALLETPIRNRVGLRVGEVRPASEAPF